MPEYIDKEKLIRDLIDNRSFYPAIVKNAIENAPTEDVVPRSEVDEIAEELSDTIVMKDELFDEVIKLRTELTKAKTEVAREIFEEIEKSIANLEYRANTPRKTVKVEELKAQCDWILHEVVTKTLATLKKKYTEVAE